MFENATSRERWVPELVQAASNEGRQRSLLVRGLS